MAHKLNAELTVCEGNARWEFTCAEDEGSSCRRRCEGADGNGECHHLLTNCEWVDEDCGIAESLNSDSATSAEGQHKDFVAWRGTVEAVWDGEWFDFEPVIDSTDAQLSTLRADTLKHIEELTVECAALRDERDRLTRALERDAIAKALQSAWTDFCADTECIPDCFTIHGPRTTQVEANFDRGNFAGFVRDWLLRQLIESEECQ